MADALRYHKKTERPGASAPAGACRYVSDHTAPRRSPASINTLTSRLQRKRIDSSRFELRMLLQVWERRIHSSNARLIPIGSWLSQSSGLGMAVKRLGQMS